MKSKFDFGPQYFKVGTGSLLYKSKSSALANAIRNAPTAKAKRTNRRPHGPVLPTSRMSRK